MVEKGENKKLVIISICIILISIWISGCVENGNNDNSVSKNDNNEEDKEWQGYYRNITRKYNNNTEKELLEIAEKLNYSFLLKRNRFVEGDYLKSNESGESNFIDNISIHYYWNRISYLEKQKESGYHAMRYEANVSYIKSMNIKIFKKNNDLFYQIETEPSIVYISWEFWENTQILIKNGSEFQLFEKSKSEKNIYIPLEQNYSNCYIIEMFLSYNVQYAPLAGLGFSLNQIIILDQNGNLLMIFKEIYRTIS
jgi:hypothetical protein